MNTHALNGEEHAELLPTPSLSSSSSSSMPPPPPVSAEDFDFNIDFDTAFSNIPIQIPSSSFLNDQQPSLHHERQSHLNSNSNTLSHLLQFDSSDSFSHTNTTPSSLNDLNSLNHHTDLNSSDKTPLFNAQESSLISQFFEKMNADPSFIFSPKLDQSFLNLTEPNSAAPPPPLANDPYHNLAVHNTHLPVINLKSSTPPPASMWDARSLEAMHPLLASPTQFTNTQTPQHPHQSMYHSSVKRETPNLSSPSQQAQNHDLYNIASSRDPSYNQSGNLVRKLPIKFGSDPRFQKDGYQPGFSYPPSTRPSTIPISYEDDGNRSLTTEYPSLYANETDASHQSPLPHALTKDIDYYQAAAGLKPKYPPLSYDPSSTSTVTEESAAAAAAAGRPRRENLSENQKRINHISSERRRRDLIKSQFKEMCSLVPKLAADAPPETTNGAGKSSADRDAAKSEAAEAAAAAAALSQSKSAVLEIVYEYILLMMEKNKLLRAYLVANGVAVDDIHDSLVPSTPKKKKKKLVM